MATHQIGRANITISVEGCLKCGTRWSSAWTLAREVPISIGAKKTVIRLHLCADCQPQSPMGADQQVHSDELAQNVYTLIGFSAHANS